MRESIINISQPLKEVSRFAKVIHELNGNQTINPNKNAKTFLSSENDYLRKSLTNISQRSTKYTVSSENQLKVEMDQNLAIDILLENYQVVVNKQIINLRTQFVPTSKGLKYIILVGEQLYVNLSWVHSAQQLQKNKMLLLYYSIDKIKSKQKPSIQSLVIEFSHHRQLLNFLSAILFIHQIYHDNQVEKVYHQLCSC